MPPSFSCLYSCVCKPGYEGDGTSCSKVDPCAALNRGGCNINVSMCFSHRAWHHSKVGSKEGLARNFCRRKSHNFHCSFKHFPQIAASLLLRQALQLKPDATQLSWAVVSASPRQAECIQTGPGKHTCVCQAGWTGDGRDCSAINNCLLPTVAGCHENATCVYVGPGQVRPLTFIATFGTSPRPFCSANAS